MSDSVRPHRQQPTRLRHLWDSLGKNIGVGCHFLLQCMKVKSESEDAQSCPTLSDPVDCSPLGSSIHGIFQARVLEWGAIAFWGDLNGKEIQKRGDICICKADSFCYKQKLTQQCKGTILKKKKKRKKNCCILHVPLFVSIYIVWA